MLGGTLPFAGDAVRDLNVTTSFVLFTTGGTRPPHPSGSMKASRKS